MSKDAVRRLFFSFAAAVAAFLCVFAATQEYPFSFVAAWDVFALTYIAISIYLFSTVPHDRISRICADEDVSTWIFFSFVVTACVSSLVIVTTLFDETGSWAVNPWLSKLSCIAVVIVSWILMHLSFTFRYAHLYYGDGNERYADKVKGLVFPEEKHPDYFDFAYFSFVVGMTFQVSDVVITSKGVRRLVLLHSLLAFVFNTVIIALTVSQMINFHPN